jgi:hypothetical protein
MRRISRSPRRHPLKDTEHDDDEGSNFTLRLVTPVGERTGALLFVAETAQGVQSFLHKLKNVMFPPQGRSSSTLSAETREGGVLLYEVRSPAGLASIALTNVPRDVGILVRETLQECGSLPIIFGFTSGAQVTLIEPVDNHIIRRGAQVDDDLISGLGSYDWNGFLHAISRDNNTIPGDADSSG